MRKNFTLGALVLLVMTGCSDPKKPSSGNFTRAIDQYLSVNGKACFALPRSLPMDIPMSDLSRPNDEVQQLQALVQAGLLQSSNTTAVVSGFIPMFGQPNKPQPVKRYDVTSQGKTYYQKVNGGWFFGQALGFCYGQESVASIVKWNEPATLGGYSETAVTYTYKLDKTADWASLPVVEKEYPTIKSTIDGANKVERSVALHLTNKGWEVNQ